MDAETTPPRAAKSSGLTETKVKTLKSEAKAYKSADGGGLYLLVNPGGSKLWRLKYRINGVEKVLAIGAYPDISIKLAREQRDAARRLIAQGLDPMAQRKAEKVADRIAKENSFESIARVWWSGWSTQRSERHAGYVMRRLEADVFPAIGPRPVAEIQAPELVSMVRTIAKRGALDMASRALQTTGQIFRYAIAHGHAARNPATDVKISDILPSRKTTNYARVDSKELPELLRAIDAYQGNTTRLAMKLLALTFVRTSELIEARWAEFDLEAGRWDIPAERMKMRTPHIVPLSHQAIEVLETLKLLTGGNLLLFPGERDHAKSMSNNTILKALERMGYKNRMTGHGFRGIASTLLHEQGFDHQHIELQLAHAERNAVSASYNHAQYLLPRAKLMQHWADHLDAVRRGAKVISLRAA